MAENKQSNLIAGLKILNIGFIKKYFINLGIGKGAILFSVLVSYKSLRSNLFL